ncbi:hypothetical protein QG516_01195 [Pedobacter gandavensis]|uniref:hypothetical protein n=1 Tax=Pedobacter gandavensis TaxID=2679963 RepID=UPI00247A840B|nr:hypothetical protein [Pedobacter gandavensis]WGQ10267.1 hypothetical protein QG516_01195 [Pedobacter gandavensis]
MMNKYLIVPLFCVASIWSSCSSLYMPNVPNTPMLSEKGELSAGVHISPKGNASINGAYAVSNHFGVLFSGSYMKNERSTKDFRHKLLEVGGGYIDTFGPDNNRIIEIYAGYGGGSADRNFRSYDDHQVLTSSSQEEITFTKTFIQVNYSSKKNSYLKLFGNSYALNYGTAIRISHVGMNTFLINNIGQPKEDNMFIEPVFFTRMRLSDAVQLQYTSSGNFGLKDRKFMTAGNSIFTIGAVVNLGGKKPGLK